MYVDDLGYGRLLVQVVVQIEAEANAHEDPEDGEPDQRSSAIFTRGPGCGCMDLHPLYPPLSVGKTYTKEMDAMNPSWYIVLNASGMLSFASSRHSDNRQSTHRRQTSPDLSAF